MRKTMICYLALVLIGLCSCSKEYMCVCTNTNTGNVSYGDKGKYTAFTKKAGEETCKNNNNLSGGSLKDCHLE